MCILIPINTFKGIFIMKKHIFITTLSVFGLLLGGCSNSITDMQSRGYDDDSFLSDDSCSYTYAERLGNVTSDSVDLQFKGFTGNDYVWYLTADETSEFSLDYSFDVEKGNFKIIEITPDKEVITLWENLDDATAEGTLNIDVEEGTSLIKIVGKKAKGDIQINATSNQEVQIIVPNVPDV